MPDKQEKISVGRTTCSSPNVQEIPKDSIGTAPFIWSEAVEAIKKANEEGYDDLAHEAEDQLYEIFVRWVGKHGTSEQKKAAAEVLKTKDIDMMRHYA